MRQLVGVHILDVHAVKQVLAGGRPVEASRRMFIVVDLPEPDGPIIATNSPFSTLRFTPWSISYGLAAEIEALAYFSQLDESHFLIVLSRQDDARYYALPFLQT